jgi:hypothetical protein
MENSLKVENTMIVYFGHHQTEGSGGDESGIVHFNVIPHHTEYLCKNL